MAQPGPSSGLSQRRRGGGGGVQQDGSFNGSSHHSGNGPSTSSVGMADEEETTYGRRRTTTPSAGPSSSSQQSQSGGRSHTLYSESGHKVAYDPRDLNDTEEESLHPRLTLMEECLLLGLKDRQGYLSFWNDSISYALRGCIILELLLRKRISIVKDASRVRLDVQDRLLYVIDRKMTGEVLLDEALKMISASPEKRSVTEWIDLLSGETWNLSKIGYQLKQVRERLAKGLVDKGILRTEKKNFLLFDMATHPVADTSAKKYTLSRVHKLCCSSPKSRLIPSSLYSEQEGISFPTMRSLLLVCCGFSANVLDNALLHLTYEVREFTFGKIEEWLEEFGTWPMAPKFGGISNTGSATGNSAAGNQDNVPRIAEGSVLPSSDSFGNNDHDSSIKSNSEGITFTIPSNGSSTNSSSNSSSRDSNSQLPTANVGIATTELVRELRLEAASAPDGMFEGIAGVLAVLARMDSLL
ncbi:unnamed protein product [Sympodiomycopsis kandeliae]